MSIENIEMIVQHEIRTRWHTRLEELGLLAVITIVLAALITAV
jgi:hypothetical protein